MSDGAPKSKGVRLSHDEAWKFLKTSHTGIFTTISSAGLPIALPCWFAVVDGKIYTSTPRKSKKVLRIQNNPRCSFLVESGEKWAELKAVHITGSAEIAELSEADEARIRAVIDSKYSAFRTKAADMPAATAKHYANSMILICITPDSKVLSWDNSRLMS